MLLKHPFLLPCVQEFSALLQFAVLMHQTIIFICVFISANRCGPKAAHSGRVFNKARELTLSAGFLSVSSTMEAVSPWLFVAAATLMFWCRLLSAAAPCRTRSLRLVSCLAMALRSSRSTEINPCRTALEAKEASPDSLIERGRSQRLCWK